MNVVIIYESLTGNTRRAAELMAASISAEGHAVTVCSTKDVELQALSEAELVIVGTWTDGVFMFGQKPAAGSRLAKLPAMGGKKAVVFCTFKIDPGQTIEKLTRIIEARGAEVIGGMPIKDRRMTRDCQEFVDRVLSVVV